MVWTGLLVYTICFIIYFFFVSSSSKSFYQQNLAYYEIASSLASLLFSYRMQMALSIESFQLAFNLWLFKFSGAVMNPDPRYIPTFGKDYFEYVIDDYTTGIDKVYSSYSNLVRKINDLNKEDKSALNNVIWSGGVSMKDFYVFSRNDTRYNYSMSPDPSIAIPIQVNVMLEINKVLQKEIYIFKYFSNWSRAEARPFISLRYHLFITR